MGNENSAEKVSEIVGMSETELRRKLRKEKAELRVFKEKNLPIEGIERKIALIKEELMEQNFGENLSQHTESMGGNLEKTLRNKSEN